MSQNISAVPAEVSARFNWGACLITGIWCIRHGVWKMLFISIAIPLMASILALVLHLNWWCLLATVLILSIYFGFKGNSWAWRKGNFASATEFLRAQKLWGVAGLAIYGIIVAFFIYMHFFSRAVDVALAIANQDEATLSYFGSPIRKSMSLYGSISDSSSIQGSVIKVDIKVKGPKNSGYLIVNAKKIDDEWVVSKFVVEDLAHEVQAQYIDESSQNNVDSE
jgi:hypothetical protein